MSQHGFRLLVGLGNPGSKYTQTRHNIGFMVLNKYASTKKINFSHNKKLYGDIAETGIGEKAIKLLKPSTYMNDSGLSIRATLDWFKLDIKQVLILVDDIDLPLGRLRMRTSGSSGGHNGLRSTIQHLGTQDFCRLRIGIGAPKSIPEGKREMTISHVLGSFAKEEKPIIDKIIDEVLENLNLLETLDLDRISTRLNSYQAA